MSSSLVDGEFGYCLLSKLPNLGICLNVLLLNISVLSGLCGVNRRRELLGRTSVCEECAEGFEFAGC
jgi:hypothetical protein